MPRKSSDALLRPVQRIQILRDRVGFWDPVIAHDAVYAGERDYDLVKFALETLEPEWRVPAEGFQFWESYRDVVLLFSFHTGRSRAMRPDGTVAWTLESMGEIGWMRWNDHLYAIGADIGMVLGDPRTGHILGPTALVLRPNDVFVRVCEDVLLVQDRNGDPFRAYDLVREEWLWERNLLADMKAQYRAWDDVPLPLIKSSGPGLLVCRRGKGLFGIGLRDGQLRWGVDGFCRTINPHQSRVYVWGGTRPELHRDRFLCLDAGTGASIYEVPIEVKGPRPGALSDRHIVYTTRDGWMAAFRLSDGARVWSHQHKQWLGGPVIAGNRLFVGAEDGYLYVFEGDL